MPRQLPQELLDGVVDSVAEQGDLMTLINCRLAGRDLNIRSREHLFSSVTLRPKRLGGKIVFTEDNLHESVVDDPPLIRSIKEVKIILNMANDITPAANRSKTLVALLSKLSGPDSSVTSFDLSADHFEDWESGRMDEPLQAEILKFILSGHIQKLSIAQIFAFPLKGLLAKLPQSVTDVSLRQVITSGSEVQPTSKDALPGPAPRLRRLAIDELSILLFTGMDSVHFPQRTNLIGNIQELVLHSPKTIRAASDWTFLVQNMGHSLCSLSVYFSYFGLGELPRILRLDALPKLEKLHITMVAVRQFCWLATQVIESILHLPSSPSRNLRQVTLTVNPDSIFEKPYDVFHKDSTNHLVRPFFEHRQAKYPVMEKVIVEYVVDELENNPENLVALLKQFDSKRLLGYWAGTKASEWTVLPGMLRSTVIPTAQ